MPTAVITRSHPETVRREYENGAILPPAAIPSEWVQAGLYVSGRSPREVQAEGMLVKQWMRFIAFSRHFQEGAGAHQLITFNALFAWEEFGN